MKIEYLGHSCFKFTSKEGISVLTDPFTKVGYELPKGTSSDIITVSHGHFDHNFIDGVRYKAVLTSTERISYQGVDFEGILSNHDEKGGALRGKNIIFKIKMDGITVCHLGDIGEPISPMLKKIIGEVDLLCVPVGGTYTITAEGAKSYIDALAPKAVIPMHYKPDGGALDIEGIEPFLRLFSKEEIQTVKNGVVEFEKGAKGIIYMERVK